MEGKNFNKILKIIEEYNEGSEDYSIEEISDKVYMYYVENMINDEEYGALLEMVDGLNLNDI